MRFHLVDRIDHYEIGRLIHARKLTSHNEIYPGNATNTSLVPKQLMLEALCQAGSWLILLSSDRRKRAALLSIESVAYLRDVPRGSTLQIRGELISFGEETAVLSGTISVADEVVLEAQNILCALIETEKLEDPQDTLYMQQVLLRERMTL